MEYPVENNFAYHSPKTEETKKKHEEVRAACRVCAEIIIELVPDTAERTLALRKIEEAMFWANAAIARYQ